MLNTEELINLEDKLRPELEENLTSIISKLNRSGDLDALLELLGLADLLDNNNEFIPFKNGKIVVVGQSKVKKEELLSVANKLSIDKNRFEFHLEYYDAAKMNFRNYQWNPNYCLIMVGPMPHSVASKGDYSSVIANIEHNEGYPPLIRLGSNELKITKTNFKISLESAINSGYIIVS